MLLAGEAGPRQKLPAGPQQKIPAGPRQKISAGLRQKSRLVHDKNFGRSPLSLFGSSLYSLNTDIIKYPSASRQIPVHSEKFWCLPTNADSQIFD